MGLLRFHIPQGLSEAARQGLSHGHIAALPDFMPWPTHCSFDNNFYVVEKEPVESGSLYVPWPVHIKSAKPAWLAGQERCLVTGTATLGERTEPYHLLTELARGKVNQVRNQAADWQGLGLNLPPSIVESLRQSSLSFARTVCQPNSQAEADRLGAEALLAGIETGEALIDAYLEQVIETRKGAQGKMPFYLSCGLETVPTGAAEEQFLATFNSVRIPFNWRLIEPREATYQWDRYDALVAWAKQNKLQIEGGPVVDLSPSRLPAWLDQNKGDAQSLANLFLDYLEACLIRYKSEIAFWTLCANAHDTTQLALDDEDQIWLNAQLVAAAKQIHPDGRFCISLSQPWAEHLAQGDRMYSAFVFCDALLRSRVELTAINLECYVGWSKRGSRLRDFVEVSRMLDLYALFGIPLTLYLSMPSGSESDVNESGHATETDGNQWSPDFQAQWATRMLALAACKPYSLSVSWSHWSDAGEQVFPLGGAVNEAGIPKPVLKALQDFRQEHFRTP
ncbi:MAG: endo-1,4-beta-xylanase [Gemmatales bacterium]